MKKFQSLGRSLSKQEQKKVLGGLLDPDYECRISADCYKQIYNFGTQRYETVKVGTVSCSGSGNCNSTSSGASCPQAQGDPDTSACPSGSYIP